MSQKEWGNITWILFHTLAEKVNKEHFPNVKNELISFIKMTCHNLPCPICSNHAIQNLSKAKLNLINTKADMIEFLRQFHNLVNIHTGKDTVEKEFVISKYKKGILPNIIVEFNRIYMTKYGNFEVNAFLRSNKRQLYLKEANKKLKYLVQYCN